MAPSGNRFDKISPKERLGGGCGSHQEWANTRNSSPPGMRLNPKAAAGLGLNATGYHILGLSPTFPMRSDPGVRFCNTNGITNFPASSYARKKEENSVQGGNNLPQEKLPPGSPAD